MENLVDGFKAYKLYTSVKLHFTRDNFNVFENRGRLRGTLASFTQRKDVKIFDRWGRNYNEREFILLTAANCMYGNVECAYSTEAAEDNYKEYMKRRQSISKFFADDLSTVGSLDPQTIVQNYIAGKITIECCVIMNETCGILAGDWPILFRETIRRIKKSSGFVKYNKERIEKILRENE